MILCVHEEVIAIAHGYAKVARRWRRRWLQIGVFHATMGILDT